MLKVKCRILVWALLPLAALASPQPNLIPQPRELQSGGRAFQIVANAKIIVASSSLDDRFAAGTLRAELKLATGRTVPIVTSQSVSPGDIVVGRFAEPSIQALLASHRLDTTGISGEGYVLDVQPSQILLAGKDAAGVFYGVQTLRQLVIGEGNRGEILAARIRDWPSMIYRGTQVDLSRGPVPKLDYLKRIVRTIAEFKMNQLNLYMEDAFPIEGHPLVGVLDDRLSREDFRQLVAYAAPYHVDIVPATEGCGHLHKVLRFEAYTKMAEQPRGHDLAADDATADAFLDGFFSQLNSVFPAQIYNIGCDETHELGAGRSAGIVQKAGYARAYLDSLMRAYHSVRRYNKQVMFWGDMAVAHPELIAGLPKDVIVATWEYFPHPSYERWIKPFTDAGLKLMICPWVGNTDLIVPDYEIASFNIGNFISEGRQAGAIGVNVTVWNDDGETLFAPNWWSIVYGAASAWEPAKTDVAAFDRKFDWAFYRNGGNRLTEALKRLSHINEIFGGRGVQYVYSSHFGGAGDWLFWRDPFSISDARI